MDDLRGSPLSVGTLEEMIDDNHAIVSSSVGPEYYVNVLSFVNQDLLEPGSSVLLHNKVGTSLRDLSLLGVSHLLLLSVLFVIFLVDQALLFFSATWIFRKWIRFVPQQTFG